MFYFYKLPVISCLLLLVSFPGLAQVFNLSGTVVDNKDGRPIPGVSIHIKGTSSGTTTDGNGQFSVDAKEGDILEFTFLSYKPKDLPVRESGKNLIVGLDAAAHDLNEIVVTAFGREQTKNEVTANVTTIVSKDISKYHATDATQALEGQVPGLVLSTPSGTPGATSVIRIRGINSVTANNSPLYVLDGMPINSGNAAGGLGSENSTIDIFSLINPNDIAQISVLKDASAVAPYGADGANGVILITTKSGKTGETKYNLSLSGGIQRTTKNGPKMANSQELWDGVSEGLWNTYGSGEFGNGQIKSRDEILDWALENNISPAITQWAKNGFADTDWKKEIQRQNAFRSDINFSLNKGSDNSRFYAGIGYNKTDGVTRGTDFRRISGNLKYSADLNKKINLGLSMSVANVSQNGAAENGDASTGFDNPFTIIYLEVPWAPVKNPDGSYNVGDDWYVFGPKNNYPYMVQHDIRNNDITRAIPMGKLEYKILKNLKFNTLVGLDYTIRYFKNYQNTINSSSVNQNGSVLENSARNFHYTFQNSLDYTFQAGQKSNFDLTVLQEYNKYKNKQLQGYGENMANDKLNNLSGASANFATTSTYDNLINARYVALLNYNFDQKYIFNGSYSYQGDSRFSNKYGNFYSLGLGWNIQEESFLKQTDFVDVLRLKFGYGLTGNAGISRNQYQELMAIGKYDNSSASSLLNFGSEATWEKSSRFDISADYAFFDSRLRGTIGVFRNRTYDMLFNVPLPLTAQFLGGEVLRNIGEMVNKGFEFSVNGGIIQTPDFQVRLNGNLSILNNKITSLSKENTIIGADYIVEQGHPAREWYLPEWAGVNPDNGLPLWYVNRELNDETTSDFAKAKRVHVGKSPIPRLSGTLGVQINYKNLFFEAAANYLGGYDVYDRWAQHTEGTNASNMVNRPTSAEAVAEAWRKPGDISDYYPRFDYGNNAIANLGERSTRNLHAGDHIRLRDLAVGYAIEHSPFLQQLKLETLTFSLRATNLFTWVEDKRLKYDPSVDDNGRILTTSPPVKSIIFNVNLNF